MNPHYRQAHNEIEDRCHNIPQDIRLKAIREFHRAYDEHRDIFGSLRDIAFTNPKAYDDGMRLRYEYMKQHALDVITKYEESQMGEMHSSDIERLNGNSHQKR